jgi:capsular polysaccharide biosynthesis protein
MQETRVLFAPHGAGLTNMMFCHEGTHVVEIADLGFPNPNFYALACAMGLPYWLLAGDGLGDVHPLEKDLRVEPRLVEEVLEQLPA